MNTIGDVIMNNESLSVVTTNGIIPLSSSGSNYTSTVSVMNAAVDNSEDLMEKWIFNRVTIDHKVQEQELMKLKEVAPDYANEIKENLSKNAARDIIKKMSFTKKHDKDADVHHFIGRVWVFTEEELKQFIKEAKNA